MTARTWIVSDENECPDCLTLKGLHNPKDLYASWGKLMEMWNLDDKFWSDIVFIVSEEEEEDGNSM